METKNINTVQQNGLSLKHNLIGLGVIAVLFGGMIIWSTSGQAKEAYSPKAPTAQATYDQLVKKLCEDGLKPLAGAKIDDSRAGVLKDQDLNDLAMKEKVDCSKAKIQWGF